MEKRKLWKGAAVVAAAAMITVSLAACNGEKEVKKTASKQMAETLEKTDSGNEYVYQTSFQEMDTKSTGISNMCECDGRIYMTGTVYEEDQETGEYNSHTCLLECMPDGSNLKETELKLKKDEYIDVMAVNNENQFYILTSVYSYNEKTQESKNKFYIKLLKRDGSIKSEHELQVKEADMQNLYFSSRTTVLKKDSSVYVADMNGRVYYFDETGKQKKTYDMKAYIDNIAETEDGSIYVYGGFGDHGSYVMKKLDMEKQEFGEPVKIGEFNIMNADMYAGSDGLIYMQNSDNLYGIDLDKGETSVLMNWVNGNVDGDAVRTFLPLKDGSFLAVTVSFEQEEGKAELVVIKKKKAADVREKKVLTMACTYLSGDLKEVILNFNKTNKDYQIELKDYSGYDDYSTKLNLDIVSGQVPDILSLNMLPADMYVKKGLLTDLYPLMEKDEEIGKEDFLDSVINTLEKDGKLYYLGSSFTINALAAGRKYLDNAEGWTFEEMQKLYESKSGQQVFFINMAREWFLQDIISGQINDLINWETGEVYMDSENFIHMLEFAENFPGNEEMEFLEMDLGKAVKKGNIMITDFNLFDISNIELYTHFYKNAGGFNIVSYPAEDKNNSISMDFYNPAMAITEKCEDKEGAWEFLRQFFTYDSQLSYANAYAGIPIRKDAFEKLLEYAAATESYTDENGIDVEPIESGYGYNGYEVPIGPLSEEETNQIRAMVDRIGAVRMSGDTVTNEIIQIIMEEAEAFYAGDKTAEEVAEIIQSRVKIYVSQNS